ALLLNLDDSYRAILIGTLLAAALGLVDDIWGLPPIAKLVGIMAIALIPVAGYDVVFDHLTLPFFGAFNLGWVAYPVTILWISTLANLITLIDGMDALAAGIVSIAAFSFALLAVSYGPGRSNAAILAACICGASLAFLRHNYHPARIFMGDSGALALGF